MRGWRGFVVGCGVVLAGACAPAVAPAPRNVASPAAPPEERSAVVERPIPGALVPPLSFQRAIARGTRTERGVPGPRYWTNTAEYRLVARVDPKARILQGDATIRYANRSPDTLREIHVDLLQNHHAPGVVRNEPAEVTGGVVLERVAVEGQTLRPSEEGVGYRVDGTRMVIALPHPLAPGGSVTLEMRWRFRLPAAGIGGRMGAQGDSLLYLAYWYPQVAVYDDVVGWHPDPFRGTAEFYQDFARYEVEIVAPVGYAVQATGRLLNPEEVWAPAVLARWAAVQRSDSPVVILPESERGRGTRTAADGWLRWRFVADSVRDVAFVATRASVWEAARTAIGDRNGDGRPDSTVAVVLYRPGAVRWRQALGYVRHAIAFLSQYTGFPYPWPHITAVEGGGIVGGGMEYPMMTLIGDYTAAPPLALYAVVAHELAHMWIPMIVSTDERRYGWMDEGSTTFHENEARNAFAPQAGDAHAGDRESYLRAARLGREGEILRWSDFHYDLGAYVIASYPKPAMLLRLLQRWLGEAQFGALWRGFLRTWAYRHPYPWDFFNYVENATGRDLDWFWRAWYDETWTLDQAIAAVDVGADGAVHVTIRDRGDAPAPVTVRVTRRGGGTETRDVPVDVWLRGTRTAVVTFGPGAPPTRVELDPDGLWPDVDRSNNVWEPR